jgi:hypothetical protein
MDPESESLERAKAVKRAHEAELLAYPNVVGVGVGRRMRGGDPTDEIGLIVLVSVKHPASFLADEERIPEQLEGVPVDVQEVGKLTAGGGG